MIPRVTMKASLRAIALAAALLAALAMPTAVSAQEYGARAIAMGGAYTGAANDITSLIYNPAGLSENSFEIALGVGSGSLRELDKFQAILSGDIDDVDDITLDLATLGGVSFGRFGAGVAAEGFVTAGKECAAGADLCGEAEYMIQLLLGAGVNLGRLPLGLADLKAGISVGRLDGRRIEYTRYEASPTTYLQEKEDLRGKGYTLNFGISFKATDTVTIGLAAQNAASNIDWSGTRTTGEYRVGDGSPVGGEVTTAINKPSDKLPPVYRAGVAIRPPALGATLAADVSSDGTVRFGVEKNLLFNALSLRAGFATGDGEQTTSAGLGIAIGPVHLDVAVESSDGFETARTFLEGSVRF